MAPRGRARKKVGQTRMDAAVDALSVMGFHKRDIRRKVNSLLKVYDGEWQFIEDDTYRVLIDIMVEDQDAKKDSKAIGGGDSSNAHVDPGPGIVHDGAEFSGAPSGTEPSSSGIIADVPTTTSTKPATAKHANDATCDVQAGERVERKDDDRPDDMAIVTCNEESGLQGVVGLLPPRRRKPCFGWIGGDEEEDCVFFETEASQRREMRRMATQNQHKHRWDVRQDS